LFRIGLHLNNLIKEPILVQLSLAIVNSDQGTLVIKLRKKKKLFIVILRFLSINPKYMQILLIINLICILYNKKIYYIQMLSRICSFGLKIEINDT